MKSQLDSLVKTKSRRVYSRWIGGSWFTLWSTLSPSTTFKFKTEKLKNSQVFEICDIPSFKISYKDITDKGLDKVILDVNVHFNRIYTGNKLNEIYDKKLFPINKKYGPQKFKKEEYDKLKEHMMEFVIDVNLEFQPKKFYYTNWMKPFVDIFKK